MPLIFSLIFFASFAIYMVLAAFIIVKNPGTDLNVVFFLLCLSMCLWSFGFSMANSAKDLEACLYWRQVSALGWGSIYSLLLHFFLLLTLPEQTSKNRYLCSLLYIPAALSVWVFSLSPKIAPAQYRLVWTAFGWVNTSVKNNWTTFFHAYYISYVLAALFLLWLWKRRSDEVDVHRQANLLIGSLLAAFVLGTLTDVLLSSNATGIGPQMAPVSNLIPIAAVFYCVRRYNMMLSPVDYDGATILSKESLSKLYTYMSLAFLLGAALSGLVLLLPHLVFTEANREAMVWISKYMFAIGLAMIPMQLVKDERLKRNLVMTAMIISIPIITLQFVQYAAITVWAIPFVLMTVAMAFDNRSTLISITVMAIFTQGLVWLRAPATAIELDQIDYVIRVGIFFLVFWIGSFVNKVYMKRLQENTQQLEFQELFSDISACFVSITQENVAKHMQHMLSRMASYFDVEQVCIYQADYKADILVLAHLFGDQPDCPAVGHLDLNSPEIEQIGEQGFLLTDDASSLPGDRLNRPVLSGQKPSSALIMPVKDDRRLLGLIELSSLGGRKNWQPVDIEQTRILSNLLSDAMLKISAEQEVQYMAYYDHLTDLPNRTLFTDRVDQAIKHARRTSTFSGIIFMDLDNFKSINDIMGHTGGDRVLQQIAQRLRASVRETDTVARFGGDEFLILSTNLAAANDIEEVVQKIMELFQEPFELNGHEFSITMSAGVAVHPFDGGDVDALIKNADMAMYMAKDQGKSRYILCTHDMKEELQHNIRLSNDLYRVHERDELILHYQPQIRLDTERIVGVEALLRWQHPELGLIPPNVFIPLAELNGTIYDIGKWVLKTSTQQVRAWQDMGLPPVRLAVNLSLEQLNKGDLVADVEAVLQDSGLEPGSLELEVTETVATKEADYIVDVLSQLKALGVTISIDDFGTEYSSLHRLKTLPIDRIKIDMQFVQALEGSEKDQAITKVIISLAKSLNLSVLAEGVETDPQREFLSERMCDEVQGFYYYRPMPAREMEELLRRSAALMATQEQAG